MVKRRGYEYKIFSAILWRQKVREKWLKEGNRNTKFFRSMANFRRKNNHVEELYFNGEAVKGNEAMRQRSKLFFQQLYKDEDGRRLMTVCIEIL